MSKCKGLAIREKRNATLSVIENFIATNVMYFSYFPGVYTRYFAAGNSLLESTIETMVERNEEGRKTRGTGWIMQLPLASIHRRGESMARNRVLRGKRLVNDGTIDRRINESSTFSDG